MEIIIIIAATLFSTTAMSIFSYIISESFKKVYKEPILLEYLMSVSNVQLNSNKKALASWVIHYTIGLAFVIGYFIPIWCGFAWYHVSILSGVVFGCIIGVLGIIGWEIMFRSAPARPPVDRSGYYSQLFFAHIVFGITTVGVLLAFSVVTNNYN